MRRKPHPLLGSYLTLRSMHMYKVVMYTELLFVITHFIIIIMIIMQTKHKLSCHSHSGMCTPIQELPGLVATSAKIKEVHF